MVSFCAAINCNNNYDKARGISMHRFPLNDPKLLKRWMHAVKRKNFEANIHHRLCSQHFTPDSFWPNYKNSRQLKDDAVPTIFDFSVHLQQKIVKNQNTEMESESPDKATCEMCGKATADVFPYVNNDEEKPEEPSESSHPKQLCQTCVTQMNMCDDLMNFLDKAADVYTPPTTSSTETEEVEITGQTIIKSMPDKDDDKDVSAESDEVLKSILNLYSGDDVVPTASQSFSSPSVVECVEQRTVEYSADTSAKYPGILTKDTSKIVDNRRLSVTVEKMQSKSDATGKIDSRKSSTDDNKKSKISEITESQRTGLVKTAVTPMEVDLTEPALSNEEPGTVPTDQNMESTVPETATVENNSVKGINIDNLLLSIDPEELFSIHGVDVTLPIKCDFCPEVFYDFDEFDDHMISHKEAHFFSCQLCSNTYISWQNLVAHRKALHHAEVISCDPCSKRRNHPNLGPVNYPVKGYPIGCEECNEGFSTPNQLYRHYKIKMNHSSKGIKVPKPYEGTSTRMEVEGKIPEVNSLEQIPQYQVITLRFICDVCGSHFPSSQELSLHMARLNGVVLDICNICGMKFCNKRVLNTHRKSHTPPVPVPQPVPEPKPVSDPVVKPERRYLCSMCGKTFKDRGGFGRHLLNHAGIKKYECEICSARFGKKDTLDSHYYIHPIKEPYICKNCHVSFKELQELRSHITRKHGDDDELICEVCNKSCSTNNFIKHYEECHLAKENEKTYLRRLTVTCPVCQKVFSQPTAMKRHLKLHTSPNKHVCEVCNETLLSLRDIGRHARLHHGEDIEKWPQVYRDFHKKLKMKKKYKYPVKKLNLICEHCGKKFTTKESLHTHIRRHRGEHRYFCSTCSKPFHTKQQLNIHNRWHTGERPYKCNYCKKRFASQTVLLMHRRIHAKVYKYVCPYCDKKYMWASGFRGHVRYHTGERPYKCTACNKGFALKHRLNMHCKTESHKIALGFQCSICEEYFYSAEELKTHEENCLNVEETVEDRALDIAEEVIIITPKSRPAPSNLQAESAVSNAGFQFVVSNCKTKLGKLTIFT